jgi:hypothetical protein
VRAHGIQQQHNGLSNPQILPEGWKFSRRVVFQKVLEGKKIFSINSKTAPESCLVKFQK